MRNFLFIILLGVALLATGGVVSENKEIIVYRQPDGLEVTIRKNPQRVIVAYASLAPVWDLAGGKAVGVSSARDKTAIPESMKHLPVVGVSTTPSVEKIVALKPDLVILTSRVNRHYRAAGLLRRMGITAVCVEYGSYDDFSTLLDFFCRINGRTIADVPAAKQVVRDVESVCAKTKGLKKPRYALIFASGGGFLLESSSFSVGRMAAMLGAENIRKTEQPGRTQFSYEQLLLDDPDVIFITTMGDAEGLKEKFRRDFMDRPAWKTLSAAKNGRVHFLPVDLFLYMPGPRYPEAFRELAKLLYPGKEF